MRNLLFLFFFLGIFTILLLGGCQTPPGDGGDSGAVPPTGDTGDDTGVDYSCTTAADCDAKNLGHERCIGWWTCVDQQCAWECEQGAEGKVSLAAEPDQGDAPLSVTFTATVHLTSEGDNERFYCPSFAWDFGDGEGYAAMPSCIPYEPGVSLTPEMHGQTHLYKEPGRYVATFTLNDIVSNAVTITVPGVNPDFSCQTDADCVAQGCSGQICGQKDANIMTTCEMQSWYECLKLNRCGCNEGVCQFNDNEAFTACVAEKSAEAGGQIPGVS